MDIIDFLKKILELSDIETMQDVDDMQSSLEKIHSMVELKIEDLEE